MLRLNLPPLPGRDQRRKITVAFNNRAQWRKAVGLPAVSELKVAKDDAGTVGKSVSATMMKQLKAQHTRDVLHAINCDADSCDDTTSDDEESSSDSSEDEEEPRGRRTSARNEPTLRNLAGTSKADLYFGTPHSGRRGQKTQLNRLFREFGAVWKRYDMSRGPTVVAEGENVPGPSDSDDHAPLSSVSTDDLGWIWRHRKITLDVLEGKKQLKSISTDPPHLALQFAYCRRQEEAQTRVYERLGLVRGRAVPDAKFTLVYSAMREFYASEEDMLRKRGKLTQSKLRAAERLRAAAIAKQRRAVRGWEFVSTSLSNAVWYEDSINQLKLTQPLQKAYVFLVDEKCPSVVETAICLDSLNQRQLLHVFQAIEDRGFRDLIWVSCDPNDWPVRLSDDDSVTVLFCPDV
ncbi:hypothetical protein HJFPF1_06320 [Paramyrothecium foliicola]|nr:hypothetical protein HJFPF1_06320 [Paramyrothecium foliicola]